MQGKVRWFKTKLGYGFLKGEDKKEYFVHYKKIQMDGFKNLLEGQIVEFEIEVTPRGEVAVNVTPK